MKKLILSAAMIAGLGMLASQAAMAADGTITFNGSISAVTCTVHGGTAGSNSGNFTVTLPTVASSAFASGVGSTAGATPYNIYVGAAGEAGCTNGTQVSVHYEPTSPRVDPATGNLKLDTGTGVATGVQLQLLNAGNQSAINLANAPDSTPITIAGNTATLPFYAQYVSTATGVTAGTANSSVLYTVKYN
ncbi:fimbrial protein [Dyella flava]|uniref:Type 1 fimbrial protein n=1 Tax=Dyella flava TaxID=1920170 RepID=A0ABS2K7D7_9GAMM|nr:fimbrial protein [Dyella flava]MBM7126640.1 type 1 fimbrial protein [Dyella flava]GLQ49540.1 fimbrial protein [Dyella flava]